MSEVAAVRLVKRARDVAPFFAGAAVMMFAYAIVPWVLPGEAPKFSLLTLQFEKDGPIILAAWVQAVGSVAAIWAATRIAGRQERIVARERQSKTRIGTLNYCFTHLNDANDVLRSAEQVEKILALAKVDGNSVYMSPPISFFRASAKLMPGPQQELDSDIAELLTNLIVLSRRLDGTWASFYNGPGTYDGAGAIVVLKNAPRAVELLRGAASAVKAAADRVVTEMTIYGIVGRMK